jgi:hypothetical protein
MNRAESEGAVSHYVQKTTFGKTWLTRNVLLAIIAVALLCGPLYLGENYGLVLWSVCAAAAPLIAVVGRALFCTRDTHHHAGRLLLEEQGLRAARAGYRPGGDAPGGCSTS